MAKDILKEAIADAKAVREVALANAKAALEEAFTPKLQSMLSAKLSEDIDEEMDEDMDEMMYDEDDMDEGHGKMHDEDMDEGMYDEDEDMDEGMYDEDEKESTDEEIDLEELLNELELEEDEAITEEEEDIEEVHRPHYEADEVQLVNPRADYVAEDEEFDLDALLKEINDLDDKKVTTEAHCYDEDGKPMPEGHCYEEGKKDKEDVSENTQVNEGIFTAIGGIVALVGAAGVVSQIEMALEDPEIAEKYPKLKKVFELLQKIGGAAGKELRREDFDKFNEEKSEELEETKAALETVKAELNEVNLLNSKLLYVNRIFKVNTLDDTQKLRVVETLDKAGSVKEAKLIYETIKDTFSVAKSGKVSKKVKTKSLREGLGMASKAAGTSTAPKKIISESNDLMKRFQKLANIKINE